MYELKKFGSLFTSKFVGNGPSSCEKRIYRAAVSQRLRNTALGPLFIYLGNIQNFVKTFTGGEKKHVSTNDRIYFCAETMWGLDTSTLYRVGLHVKCLLFSSDFNKNWNALSKSSASEEY